MAQSEVFKKWHKIECAKRLGLLNDIEEIINESMCDKNIKVEYIK